ncbi:hypothetical protein CAC42_2462 [Sphaceloma murrayae]|uniref:Uncharacterized protein n=1 Tax=Sphaceloma murrayae TaxID=2082308 RepID=A0A2K1QW41_9PEZI|nr:hypothetical protein CAC42_2462 [Sphaceloma murrayae]
MYNRGRSPPYPPDYEDELPGSRATPTQYRDVSPEVSTIDTTTSPQPHLTPTGRVSRDSSSDAAKAHVEVTVQDAQMKRRLSVWQRLRYWANRNWVYELAACCISVTTLGGVVILLCTRQNKPLPDWPTLITLNSLIAVLTTIMKGCMIFAVAEGISQLKWSWFLRPRPLADLSTYDSASRGPWGSLLFLFSGKVDGIATVGAIITIVALAVDPFAQQVFLFESCMQEQNDTMAMIPRVQVFAPVMAGDRLGTGSNQLEIFSGMLRATYSAMIEPAVHIPARLDPSCPSGNCTWNATDGYYQTLIMSHACMDVTPFIVNSTTNQSDVNTWKYDLPSANEYTRASVNMSIDYSTTLHLQTSSGGDSSRRTPAIFRTDEYTTFAFGALFWKQVAKRNPIEDARIVTPMAVTCKMWPTLKTYNARVVSGDLEETEVATRDVSSWEILDRYLVDGVWHNCTGTRNATTENTIGLRNGRLPLSSSDRAVLQNGLADLNVTYLPPRCTVQIGPMVASQYSVFLQNMFNTRIAGRADTPQQGTLGSLRSQNSTVGNQMHLAALLNEGNADLASMTRYMQAMAGALGAFMRTSANISEPANARATGTAQVVRTCARVRWGWLALPVGLTVATVAFVVAVIAQTSSSRKNSEWPGLLKSSPLGLLLYGPKDEGFLEYSGPKDLVVMEAAAEEIKTTLERKFR